MTRQQAVDFLITKPYKLGHLLGFTKLTDLHNVWIIDMLKGKKDKTLQAHRGSYKTTCVSITLALIIVLLPNIKTLFINQSFKLRNFFFYSFNTFNYPSQGSAYHCSSYELNSWFFMFLRLIKVNKIHIQIWYWNCHIIHPFIYC